jgi:hypothetical protein
MTELDRVLLPKLARIGQSEMFAEFDTLFPSPAARERAGGLVRLGHTEWLAATEGWDDGAVVGLIKALVYAEREVPGWGAGSVQPAIWLLDRLTRTWSDEQRDPFADWILANTENPYLPFGSMRPHARSMEELRKGWAEEATRKRERQARAASERARHAHQRAVKNLVARDKATRDLRGAVLRGDRLAVQALLRKGADIRAVGSDGLDAVAVARQSGRANIEDVLLGRQPTETPNAPAQESRS